MQSRRFPVFALPGRALAVVVAVELATALLVVGDVVRVATGAVAVTPHHLATAGLLTAAGVLHQEVSSRVERYRSRVASGSGTAALNLGSLWIATAAVLCPTPVAVAVAVVSYLHLRCFVYPAHANRDLYKIVYSASATLLAVHAASAVTDGDVTLATTVGALAAYLAVDTVAVVGVVVLSGVLKIRDLPRLRPELTLETALLCLAALLTAAMSIQLWLIAFVFPPLLLLHRALFVRQLELAARIDGKTGLLTAATWHELATAHLDEARVRGRSVGVLIVDIDQFKELNDRYGHLAGDAVLAALARTLRTTLRRRDAVGRFGGEEFVVLLPLPHTAPGESARAELGTVAERIRAAAEALRVEAGTGPEPVVIDHVTVSVGGAVFPDHGHHLLDVVAAADAALYEAKRSGRNAVRLAKRRPAPAGRAGAEQTGRQADRDR